MAKLWQKYKSVFFYAVFGVLTTVINVVAYTLCFQIAGIPNVPSNIIAWAAAVAFAFVTNKLWVFNSKSMEIGVLLSELWKFVSCRLTTGVLDVVIMFVGVDLLSGPPTFIKIGSNVLVIVLNYVFSKLIIFKNSAPRAEL